MSIGEICRREVITISASSTITQAARRMRDGHVGALVVMQPDDNARPIGMLTDRDIVVSIVAKGLDPDQIRVEEVIRPELFVAQEGDSTADAAGLMRAKGVRRLPVVSGRGLLIGIVTADDVMARMAHTLSTLTRMVYYEQRREADMRP